MVSPLAPSHTRCAFAPPTSAAGTPQNYEEALRIAETREREVRGFFDKYDLDGSGTIDMEEILAIMEEMGLLKNLKTDRITFCSEMFVKYDANDDGVLRRALTLQPPSQSPTHARTARTAATAAAGLTAATPPPASTSSRASTTRRSTTREGASAHPSQRRNETRRQVPRGS